MQRAQLPPIARFGRSNPRAVSQRHPHVCRPRLARRARRRWLARSCARCCAATSSRPLHTLPQSCSRTCILRRCAVLCARALGHEHGTIMRRRANWTSFFFQSVSESNSDTRKSSMPSPARSATPAEGSPDGASRGGSRSADLPVATLTIFRPTGLGLHANASG